MTDIQQHLDDVFNRVALHLLTQKVAARGFSGDCRYRYGPLRCAVGALIADEQYKVSLEGQPSDNHEVTEALVRSGIRADEIIVRDMLQELQGMHDAVEPVDWIDGLRGIIKRYRISVNLNVSHLMDTFNGGTNEQVTQA